MEASGHQLDFILLHIWQEIPHAPTPTVSSTDLPHNARVEPKYLKERGSAFLAGSFGGELLSQLGTVAELWAYSATEASLGINAYLFLWMMSARFKING